MKEAWLQFWQARTTRERMILLIGGVLLSLILVYLFVWQPISTERKRLRVTLPELRAKAAQMRVDAQEVARLQGTLTPSTQGLRGLLEQSAQTAGLKDKITSTDLLAKQRARIVIADVPFDAFVSWVSRLQQESRVRMESGQVEALPEAGRVKVQATFTLAEAAS